MTTHSSIPRVNTSRLYWLTICNFEHAHCGLDSWWDLVPPAQPARSITIRINIAHIMFVGHRRTNLSWRKIYSWVRIRWKFKKSHNALLCKALFTLYLHAGKTINNISCYVSSTFSLYALDSDLFTFAMFVVLKRCFVCFSPTEQQMCITLLTIFLMRWIELVVSHYMFIFHICGDDLLSNIITCHIE